MGKIRKLALSLRALFGRVNLMNFSIGLASLLVIVGAGFFAANTFKDPPIVEKSFSKLIRQPELPQNLLTEIEGLVSVEASINGEVKDERPPGRVMPSPDIYRSKQVFLNASYRKDLPRVKLQLRLETPFDTRDLGATAEFVVTSSDLKRIPKGSRVLCKAAYSGSRSRVFFGVSQLITPTGDILKPMGRILSARDGLPGLRGNLHSGSFVKAIKTVGLAVVGGAASVALSQAEDGNSTEEVLREAAAESGVNASEALISDELSKKSVVYVTIKAGKLAMLSLP